jgi:hypothetical protein
MEAQMSDKSELDEVLAALDLHTKVYSYFESLGANNRQAETGARCAKDLFTWDGVRLKFKETDSIAVDDPKVAKIIGERYDFLLPPKKTLSEVAATIDPLLVEKAAGGNLTARGEVLKIIADGAKPTPEHIAEMNRLVDEAKSKRSSTSHDKEIAELVSNAHASRTTNGGSGDGKNNPWSADNWSIPRQLSIVKSLGVAKASELAASANSFIGATKPGSVNLTSYRRAG